MSIVPHATDTNYILFFILGYNIVGLLFGHRCRQDSGRGAVISKNNQLRSEAACDCIQAVKHGNGRDWWIIFKDAQIPNNQFYVYSITSTGVSLIILIVDLAVVQTGIWVFLNREKFHFVIIRSFGNL
ncbi:MAG: hypothetical protein IPF81_19500 [Bacteroidetes bacterium]|nr:hypothetical protein [Bacteroidota bacterium]